MSQATVATRARDFFTLPQHNSLVAASTRAWPATSPRGTRS
jgi:hypothetical protein